MSGFCSPPVTQVDICFPCIYKGEMERLFDCVWRVGGGQKSSACTEGKIYVPRFCFLPSLQPYPWPSLLIFHSTIPKLLKRRPLLKFINKIKSLNGYGVVGRGEFFFFFVAFFRAALSEARLLCATRSTFRPRVVARLLLCEHCLPPVLAPLCYLRVVDGRGHGWRLSSAVPCEEAACCGPQLAALMTSFTYCSLHSFATSWGPNEHGSSVMKPLWVISHRGRSGSTNAVFVWCTFFCCMVRHTGPREVFFLFFF